MKTIQILLMVCALFCASCGKNFLDVKRDKKLVVPHTISDFQGLLDDAILTMNTLSSHELGVIGADEYYVKDGALQTLVNAYEKNGYLWADDIFQGEQCRDWNWAFRRILYANTALDGIKKIQPSEQEDADWKNVKGSALFFRALNYYNLAQLFCKPYDAAASEQDFGLPIRLEADITLKSTRSNLKETYDQVIADLNEAIDLLPAIPAVRFRPSKAAAYALFCRLYLQFRQYDDAERFAGLALQLQNDLLDFNDLDPSAAYTFPYHQPEDNPEIIFYDFMGSPLILSNRLNVDTMLLKSYSADDVRPAVFFRATAAGRVLFKGSYASDQFFTGFAVDELLLTRAECYAREGKVEEALADMNRLLIFRYKKNLFKPVEMADGSALLRYILEERHKELLFRGIRWEDLRRLNKEKDFEKTLLRKIDGQRYELPPNGSKYVWPIPENEVQRSGLQQNPR